MHACFVFWILLGPLVSSSVSRDLFERFFVLILQGIDASICISNFFLAFFDGFLELSVSRIDEINASRFPSIVELWFFDGPLLLSTCRTKVQATNSQVW